MCKIRQFCVLPKCFVRVHLHTLYGARAVACEISLIALSI